MGIKFDMISLFVKDIKRMVSFYKNILGLEIEWDENSPYAEFKHEGIRFSMYTREKLEKLFEKEPAYPNNLNGTFELAIDLPLYENVDVEFKRLIEGGAESIYEPRNEPWGMRSSMIADPEGNLIEIGSWNKGKK